MDCKKYRIICYGKYRDFSNIFARMIYKFRSRPSLDAKSDKLEVRQFAALVTCRCSN